MIIRRTLLGALAINLTLAGVIAALHAYTQSPTVALGFDISDLLPQPDSRPPELSPTFELTQFSPSSETQPTQLERRLKPSAAVAQSAALPLLATGSRHEHESPAPSLLPDAPPNISLVADADPVAVFQTNAPNQSASAAVEFPIAANLSAPGSQLTVGRQRVTIEAVTPGEDGEAPVLEVAIESSPEEPEAKTTAKPVAAQRKKTSNRQWGFTPEEELFRAKWGWAAFDQARRAALEAAGNQ